MTNDDNPSRRVYQLITDIDVEYIVRLHSSVGLFLLPILDNLFLGVSNNLSVKR